MVKVRDMIQVLEKLGFFKWHQVGSHAQYKHPDGRRTTLPIHHGKDIRKKMPHGIIHDLGLTVAELRDPL